MLDAVTTMAPQVAAGKVRALGVSAPKRSVTAPDVPALQRQQRLDRQRRPGRLLIFDSDGDADVRARRGQLAFRGADVGPAAQQRDELVAVQLAHVELVAKAGQVSPLVASSTFTNTCWKRASG